MFYNWVWLNPRESWKTSFIQKYWEFYAFRNIEWIIIEIHCTSCMMHKHNPNMEPSYTLNWYHYHHSSKCKIHFKCWNSPLDNVLYGISSNNELLGTWYIVLKIFFITFVRYVCTSYRVNVERWTLNVLHPSVSDKFFVPLYFLPIIWLFYYPCNWIQQASTVVGRCLVFMYCMDFPFIYSPVRF